MTSGILMVGGSVLLVYLFVTGQLTALINVVVNAAKGQTVAPGSGAGSGGAGRRH